VNLTIDNSIKDILKYSVKIISDENIFKLIKFSTTKNLFYYIVISKFLT